MRYLVLTAIGLLVGCNPSGPPKSADSGSETTGRAPPPFSIAEQDYDLGKGWSMRLPGKFRQGVEDGNLVFWRKGLTVYAVVWNNDRGESEEQRLSWIKEHASPEGFEVRETQDAGVLRFSYRLTEDRGEKQVHALYGYVVGPKGHVQMAAYFDHEADVEAARKIWLSVSERPDRDSAPSGHGKNGVDQP